MAAPSDGESARKWLHLAPGFLALLLRWAGPWSALALCGALLAFNLWIFPRLGSARLWRDSDRARGAAPGLLFYPAALLVVALAARGRLEVLAGAWGMLAFGDAAATLVGARWGRRRLPWNPAKSWLGSLSFVGAAWASAASLVLWTAPGSFLLPRVLIASGVAALVAGLAESLPWILDDNLSVTLLAAAMLFVGLEASAKMTLGPPVSVLALGALTAAALAVAARVAGALDTRGALVGGLLALAVLAGGGMAALGLLALFVVAGTAAGRYRRWRQGEGREPARGWHNALANGAVAAACGLAAVVSPERWPILALSGALAAATADTVGGEIGQALGGATWRASDGRRVAPGTDGGVSAVGTAVTLGSAALVAAAGVLGGLLSAGEGLWVAAAGALGAVVDSYLGATLERRDLLDNEAVNLLATLTAAWLAAQTSFAWP